MVPNVAKENLKQSKLLYELFTDLKMYIQNASLTDYFMDCTLIKNAEFMQTLL